MYNLIASSHSRGVPTLIGSPSISSHFMLKGVSAFRAHCFLSSLRTSSSGVRGSRYSLDSRLTTEAVQLLVNQRVSVLVTRDGGGATKVSPSVMRTSCSYRDVNSRHIHHSNTIPSTCPTPTHIHTAMLHHSPRYHTGEHKQFDHQPQIQGDTTYYTGQ